VSSRTVARNLEEGTKPPQISQEREFNNLNYKIRVRGINKTDLSGLPVVNRHPSEEPGTVPDEIREAAFVLQIRGETHDHHVQRRDRSEEQNHSEALVISSPPDESSSSEVPAPARVDDDREHHAEHHECHQPIQATEHHSPRREENDADHAGGVPRVLFGEFLVVRAEDAHQKQADECGDDAGKSAAVLDGEVEEHSPREVARDVRDDRDSEDDKRERYEELATAVPKHVECVQRWHREEVADEVSE